MQRVIVESPYAGDVERNIEYAHKCISDCLKRGEAPFLSHILYTKALNDLIEYERDFGIRAGFEWGSVADKVVVYEDYGISHGMILGIENAKKNNKPLEYRKIL